LLEERGHGGGCFAGRKRAPADRPGSGKRRRESIPGGAYTTDRPGCAAIQAQEVQFHWRMTKKELRLPFFVHNRNLALKPGEFLHFLKALGFRLPHPALTTRVSGPKCTKLKA